MLKTSNVIYWLDSLRTCTHLATDRFFYARTHVRVGHLVRAWDTTQITPWKPELCSSLRDEPGVRRLWNFYRILGPYTIVHSREQTRVPENFDKIEKNVKKRVFSSKWAIGSAFPKHFDRPICMSIDLRPHKICIFGMTSSSFQILA